MKTVIAVVALVVLVMFGCTKEELKAVSSSKPSGMTRQLAEQTLYDHFWQNGATYKWRGGWLDCQLKELQLTDLQLDNSIKDLNNGSLPPEYQSKYSDCIPVTFVASGMVLQNRGAAQTPISFHAPSNYFWLCKTHEGKWEAEEK